MASLLTVIPHLISNYKSRDYHVITTWFGEMRSVMSDVDIVSGKMPVIDRV